MPKVTPELIDKINNRKKIYLEVLEKHLGIVSAASEATGICRGTYYKWCKEDADFKAKADDIQNIVIDFVEAHLYKKIQLERDVTAMIFFLKCKGKKRGWNERIEVSGKVDVNLKNLPLAELKALERSL